MSFPRSFLIALSLITAVIAIPASAQDRGPEVRSEIGPERGQPRDVAREIYRLAGAIADELRFTEASPAELAQVRDQLRESLTLLRDGGVRVDPSSPTFKLCFDFAYSKHVGGLGANLATDKAMNGCRAFRGDLDQLKYLTDKHLGSLGASKAMDKAFEQATRELRGKQDILEYAFTKYVGADGSSGAATKAATNTALARRNTLDCLRMSFDRRSGALGSSGAMTAAFADCQ